ncbi:MAG: hypothetical protein RI947_1002 [Candidatus Parcubacteria bacterium]|jgi:3-phytase
MTYQSRATQTIPVITGAVMVASCELGASGDANCDGAVDISDFEVFRSEFLHILQTTNSDFDNDGTITITDFETWRRGYNNQTTQPTSTPTTISQSTPTVSQATITTQPTTSTQPSIPPGGNVTATVETAPVPHSGDAADDPAIWVNPANPGNSTVIGTDKLGGIAVYDLAGKQLQYLPDGQLNNVDIRDGFSLGGQQVSLVTAGNRTNNSIAIYKVNPSTRLLENVAARTITTLATYGSCMYRSIAGQYYYFVNSKSGGVEQWELKDNGAGKVDATKVRSFSVGSQTEGCVADDKAAEFYIGEEAVAIWKYSAAPNGGSTRTQVDNTSGHVASNIEGLTIAYTSSGSYLMASSQGNNSYVVYRLGGSTPVYVKTFKIVDGAVDGTSGTDGIDVTATALGSAFPNGVFIAQDGSNSGGNQNYKLVPLELILGN